jgi:hypothetical protein
MDDQEKLLLIATTLPHFLILTISPRPFYSFIVFTSTSLSVLWHSQPMNHQSLLALLDNSVGIVWGLTDFYFAWNTDSFTLIFYLNTFIFLTNVYANYLFLHCGFSYAHAHSIWHLLSAFKSFLVALHLSGV